MIIAAIALASARFTLDQDSALIQLARQSVEAEVLGKPIPKPAGRSEVHPVFVTIERNGKVLGCRGDLAIRTASLESEVILAARGAAAHDPRYRPLTKADLNAFLVTVTVVNRTEPIDTATGLEPEDGLVLKSGTKTGIVLPWEGKDPSVRLRWAYLKAGVSLGSPVTLFRLIASRSRG